MGEQWTIEKVANRLEEAAATMRLMPSPIHGGLRAVWPAIIHNANDAYGWNDADARPGPPDPCAIARMDEALAWLRWLKDADYSRVVWSRANLIPWRDVARKLKVSRSTANRIHRAALEKILEALQHKK